MSNKNNCSTQYHYVYRIANKTTKKHYYGKRSSKILPSLDIGIRYFSSSRDKEFLKEQKTFPERFKYKVVKMFTTNVKAVEYEILLHEKFEVGKNPNFYNRSKQTSTGWDTAGVKLPEGSVSWNKGKIPVKDTVGNVFQIRTDDPRYLSGEVVHVRKGIRLSKIARDNISKGHQGHKNANSIPVNVYNYYTDSLIAENVVCNEWCKNKNYTANQLMKTLKGDRSKPHCSNSEYKERVNPLHHKGIYLKNTLMGYKVDPVSVG